MRLFRKKTDPAVAATATAAETKDQVKQWTSVVRRETYKLDRQIQSIQREVERVKRSMNTAAKKGNREVCVLLAKEIVRSKTTINKLLLSKTQMHSIILQMKSQQATLRMAGSLQKSSEVMKMMHNLIKVPEVASTMRELSKEMMKAGVIGEMMEDTMENIMDDSENMEEEVQSEVDKVIWEVTAGALDQAPMVVTETLGRTTVQQESTNVADLEELSNRLQALKN